MFSQNWQAADTMSLFMEIYACLFGRFFIYHAAWPTASITGYRVNKTNPIANSTSQWKCTLFRDEFLYYG